jgi:ABC-type amino acid transport substrate-binding protein
MQADAVAADSNTTAVTVGEAHSTVGLPNSNTKASEAVPPDIKSNDDTKSSHPETLTLGSSEANDSPSDKDMGRMVAVLLARSDIKSASDLTGKTVAIDAEYFASNVDIRTAISAAGGSEVQLSEGQATAVERLIDGEVPAAVLALVPAKAAYGFPDIAGFKIIYLALSPLNIKPPR